MITVTLTGKRYQQRVCDIYLNGDRIQEMATYLDTAYDKDILSGGSIHPNQNN
jgi:hypothetical protein